MEFADFEKKIAHLSQVEKLTVAIRTIGNILIDKGIVTKEEAIERFLADMPPRPKSHKKNRHNATR